MPIATDPDQRVDFVLKHDAQKPPESRPAFVCRAMSRRESRRVLDMVQAAHAERDDARSYQMLVEALRVGVVGWRHMPIPFDFEQIDTICGYREIWELAWGYPLGGNLPEADRPKSEPVSPVSGVTPAGTAPQPTA